jgi:hypothetical protein
MTWRTLPSQVWYHGSPEDLTELAAGSTITPHRALARAFSHKPTLLCIEDDGTIRHNGLRAGILYRIAEPLTPADLSPHPRSTMPAGLEWLTRRPLRLCRLGRTRIRPGERLSEEEVRALLARAKA